jgi:hypothetical protein
MGVRMASLLLGWRLPPPSVLCGRILSLLRVLRNDYINLKQPKDQKGRKKGQKEYRPSSRITASLQLRRHFLASLARQSKERAWKRCSEVN